MGQPRVGEDLPPLTEAVNPQSLGLDSLDSRQIVELMHEQDRQAWEAFDNALDGLARIVDRVVEGLRRGGRLIYVGAGTSGRLGVLDAAECAPTFGVSADQVTAVLAGGKRAFGEAVEGAEDCRLEGARSMANLAVDRADVVCGITSSGSTAFVRGALSEARERHAATALLTCNPLSSELQDGVDEVVELLVGPEVIAGSTRLKAGTATKMALNMITTAAMVGLGKVYDNRMVDLSPSNEKLRRRATALVEELGRVSHDRAEVILSQCDGNVKAAIVVARKAIAPPEAKSLLLKAEGVLNKVIGPSGG